jgi:dienelactone hydrolase
MNGITSITTAGVGLGALLTLALATVGCAKELPAVEQLPTVRELPDPFCFLDGTRVKTREDWPSRRAELKEIIQHYGYGHLPPAPKSVKAQPQEANRIEAIGATERRLVLTMGPEDKVLAALVLTIPDGKGPFPAIIVGDLSWGKVKAPIVAEVVKRGYILAEFDRTAFAADSKDRAKGLYPCYPDSDFAALAAWAWGFHRVADYLLTLPYVDGNRIAVTGHSRGGKAALLAGAFDERIALTAPNNSGCGGAGCTRFLYGKCESIGAITKNFPFWFHPRFAQFVTQVERLPFDQHSIKALVAPRALLSTEGMEDIWANPPGTQLTHQAAKVVYDFLGAGSRIGVVYRAGGHGHNLQDWQTLLDFADAQFFGKDVKRRFDELPYPDDSKRGFSWTAPPKP